jgi:hypothetical protein
VEISDWVDFSKFLKGIRACYVEITFVKEGVEYFVACYWV